MVSLKSQMVSRFLRGRSSKASSKEEVVTTIECKKCGFKEMRKFIKGDYILKSVDLCPKCSESRIIKAIYAEEKNTRS